jgi:hypothetical protein
LNSLGCGGRTWRYDLAPAGLSNTSRSRPQNRNTLIPGFVTWQLRSGERTDLIRALRKRCPKMTEKSTSWL